MAGDPAIEAWHDINLNHEIRFKLTPLGEQLWLDHFKLLYVIANWETSLPKRDGEWFIEQLWVVASVLGPHFRNGFDVPMETVIQVKLTAQPGDRTAASMREGME